MLLFCLGENLTCHVVCVKHEGVIVYVSWWWSEWSWTMQWTGWVHLVELTLLSETTSCITCVACGLTSFCFCWRRWLYLHVCITERLSLKWLILTTREGCICTILPNFGEVRQSTTVCSSWAPSAAMELIRSWFSQFRRLQGLTLQQHIKFQHIRQCTAALSMIYSVSQRKTSPTFLAVTLEIIIGFS